MNPEKMSMERTYRRLPGRSGIFIRHSLWMAPDHLLRVRAHPFAQEYRRYHYKDIQALILTERESTAQYYLYGFAAFFGLLAFVLPTSGHPVWGTLSAFVGAFLFYAGWRIPNCACRIQTRVSTDRLPSLGKIRIARKALPLVRSAVDQVQGEFNRELALPLNQATTPLPNSEAVPRQEKLPEPTTAHWVLFGLLLLHGTYILAAVAFSCRGAIFVLGGYAIGAAAFVAAIVAAVQQRNSYIARAVQGIVYACLCWQVLSFVGGLGLGGYIGFQVALKRSVALNFTAATRLFNFINASAHLLLALAGMILLWRHQRSTRTPPSVEQDPVPAVWNNP